MCPKFSLIKTLAIKLKKNEQVFFAYLEILGAWGVGWGGDLSELENQLEVAENSRKHILPPSRFHITAFQFSPANALG